MEIVLEVVGIWICLSLVLGTLFAWAFFFPERRAKATQAVHDRWIATHPTALQKLAWFGWEDACDDDVANEKLGDLRGTDALDH